MDWHNFVGLIVKKFDEKFRSNNSKYDNIQHDFLPSGSDEDLGKTSGGLLNVKKKKKSEKPGYKMFDADDSDSEPVLYDDSNR